MRPGVPFTCIGCAVSIVTRTDLNAGVFEAGGIDYFERQIAELSLAFAAVARHARFIVDQREAAADEPVEQRRFADIGPADNGDSEGHGSGFEKRSSISS